ncbi:GNAT family N-acetyltransferase [Aspergillus stella-maris]|uniref:GNAT family N-acetyltransferase n=1 Tax=Aspergillus stella-maris TaxID=1810926 RepID=UPI003CCDD334
MATIASKTQVRVSPITDPFDLARFFDITASAFGTQVADGFWMTMNPGWDTDEGRKAGITRFVDRWESTTTDRNGKPNTIFLKATVDNNDGKEVIAGAAIWVQASMLDGYGDKPATDLGEAMDLNALYPGDLAEQRYVRQVDRCLHKRRVEVIQEAASTSSPAVMVLDLCAVDPAFQRRGVANALVQWGLDEARGRGGLEAVLEGSSMGRLVYGRMGFNQDGGEIVYEVDEEFRGRSRPSNVFMRTGRPV